MNLAMLDYYFPFLVFVYGFTMTVLLNSKFIVELAEKKLPQAIAAQFLSHKVLGFVCLVVGMFWSVQNLLLSEPPL